MFQILPVFTKCCYFFPLRYGLIAYGYIRLARGMYLLTDTTRDFIDLKEFSKRDPAYTDPMEVMVFLIALIAIDIALSIVFVIGGHKKNLKHIRIYYIYAFITCVRNILLVMPLTTYANYLGSSFGTQWLDHWVLRTGTDFARYLVKMCIQVYALLLIRSLIIKMRTGHNRATNQVVEDQYIEEETLINNK